MKTGLRRNAVKDPLGGLRFDRHHGINERGLPVGKTPQVLRGVFSTTGKGKRMSRVWSVPIILSLSILFGLLSALLGTGYWYFLSWAAMSAPLVVIGRKIFIFGSNRPES